MAALELIWKMSQSENPESYSGQSPKHGKITQMVKDAIIKLKGDFSARDIERSLNEQSPNFKVRLSTISTILKRLEDKSFITKANDPKGRTSAKFKYNPFEVLEEQRPQAMGEDDSIPF